MVAGYDFWCSPQGRARQTAGLVLAKIAGTLIIDDRLSEIDLGEWSGLTRAEIARVWPGSIDESADFLWQDAAPGGEGFPAIAARAQAFLAEISCPGVIVTHSVLSRFLRGAMLGLDIFGIEALPDEQGVVYHMKDGVEICLG